MGLTRERPGAEGPVRIAPARRPSQGDSGILPRGIATEPPSKPVPAGASGSAERLTPLESPAYHPPDDERADALTWALARLCAFQGSDVDPGPSGEDRAQSR
jgi:hypothetical protein